MVRENEEVVRAEEEMVMVGEEKRVVVMENGVVVRMEKMAKREMVEEAMKVMAIREE